MQSFLALFSISILLLLTLLLFVGFELQPLCFRYFKYFEKSLINFNIFLSFFH